MIPLLFAVTSIMSSGLLVGLIHLLIVLLVIAIVYFIVIWIMGQMSAPAIAIKIVQIIFGLIALLFVIQFLLGVVG